MGFSAEIFEITFAKLLSWKSASPVTKQLGETRRNDQEQGHKRGVLLPAQRRVVNTDIVAECQTGGLFFESVLYLKQNSFFVFIWPNREMPLLL